MWTPLLRQQLPSGHAYPVQIEFSMCCSRDICSTLSSWWTKKRSTLDCTGTCWTSWGSHKLSSQACPFQLHCSTSCHLHTCWWCPQITYSCLPWPSISFLLLRLRRRFLLSHASFQPALLDILQTRKESSYSLTKVTLSDCQPWPAPLSLETVTHGLSFTSS